MFRCPEYILNSIRMLMVRNGDLSLLGDYFVVGLGGGHTLFPRIVEGLEDVSGYAYTIKTYTGSFNGKKISFIAIGGGPTSTEWICALAYMRKVKAVIGVGWCGALQHYIEIGDVVIPFTVSRDEDTSTHYVDPSIPASTRIELISIAKSVLEKRLEKYGSRLWIGNTVTTSAMLAETPERVREWSRCGLLCVDCETSILYTLLNLLGIPSIAILVVSDNVIKGVDCGFNTDLSRKVENVFDEVVKASIDIIKNL